MNRFISIRAVSVSAVILTLVPVFGIAASVPTVEPSNGFTIGVDPAWAPRHTNAGTTEHREYHKQAGDYLKVWKAENKPFLNTEKYVQELRKILVNRAHEHRMFHGWDKESDAQRAWREANPETASDLIFFDVRAMGGEPEVATVIVAPVGNYNPMLSERRYEGSKPSSRLMRDKASMRRLVQ